LKNFTQIKIYRNSSNIDFNFSNKQGLGIARFLSHIKSDCVDLIMKMLVYNPDERLSAKQALSHPYFKELVEQEAKMGKASLIGFNQINLMKSFHNGNDSQSDIKR
jgi:serine/threonine protein kinase